MDLRAIQAYATVAMTIFLVVMLYSYIAYLYRSEKEGKKDYEKLGRLALDDDITSPTIDSSDK